MRCLPESDLQAFADGEPVERASEHIRECASCRDRVEAMRLDGEQLASVVNGAGDLPPAASARLRQTIAMGRPRRGSTTLRQQPSGARWTRPALVSAVAAAGVIALVVFGLLPRFGAPTTLSASEVLGRSLQTLSSTRGVERLEYELVSDGIARGAWRIEQLIDHEQPTRYRVSAYTGDGVLHSALSQDPVRGQRAQLVRVDGRAYIVKVDSLRTPILSLPQMGQALVETVVAMMQATSDQRLSVVDGPAGPHYIVEIPPVTPSGSASTLELYRARAVVNGGDFAIQEFEASGALLRQPFTVSFKLLRRSIRPVTSVPDSEFAIQPGAGDVVLDGVASDEPVSELLNTLVRALARDKAF